MCKKDNKNDNDNINGYIIIIINFTTTKKLSVRHHSAMCDSLHSTLLVL